MRIFVGARNLTDPASHPVPGDILMELRLFTLSDVLSETCRSLRQLCLDVAVHPLVRDSLSQSVDQLCAIADRVQTGEKVSSDEYRRVYEPIREATRRAEASGGQSPILTYATALLGDLWWQSIHGTNPLLPVRRIEWSEA